MNIQFSPRAFFAVGLVGLLAGCGGGYGGGGGSNPPASLTISIEPSTITLGQSATITWNSNAPCTASGDWSGSKSMSGTEVVTPSATGSFTYTLVCRGEGYGSSERESTTLTVNPAAAMAGLWIGDSCCVASEEFKAAGLTDDAGDYRFLLLGTHYIGKAGAAPVAYATCDNCLAGLRADDASAFRMLSITPGVEAIASVRAPPGTPGFEAYLISAKFDPASRRPSRLADLGGSYTTYLGTGYTLTITIDAAGEVMGTDTNGCSLKGKASAVSPGANNFRMALSVGNCGSRSGRYDGNAALTIDGSGRPNGLFLSASNSKAAIGWRLSR